ncbi:MAG TPA: type 1 glutamine amidotransferase domain-containing protein [Gemmatimonadales bacterium]|nr:type 1 glutamine amidotransferase domain-containing protein [Gemmatimonadales bacterium]
MANQLKGHRVAILAVDGVERVELTEPKRALDAEGAQATVISSKSGEIKSWEHDHWGDQIRVDQTFDKADPAEFDALLLPGGVINADTIRMEKKAVEFVSAMARDGKPIAVICHGPWILIEAGVVRGRTMTSWPSLKTDLQNAGAKWVDQDVVTDKGLVSSRKPADLPAFSRKLIEEIGEGSHAARRAA